MIQLNGLRAKNDHRNLSIPKVLLILDAAIDRNQNIELAFSAASSSSPFSSPPNPAR
jgi:hypothetical protein